MGKINFNVSARTARLIGRENVSNPNGALIELLKNCHDADSSESILIFNIKYDSIPKTLSKSEFDLINSEFDDFKTFYSKSHDGNYELTKDEKLDEDFLGQIFRSYNSILLCDNGHGMTSTIIEDNWMTIGTDNKLEDPYSPTGRVKSGAKGIGRFALDRLGRECELHTFSDENPNKGLRWYVDWDAFEAPNKKIDEISADLDEISSVKFVDIVSQKITSNVSKNHFSKDNYRNGTLIDIRNLRDWWKIDDVKKSYQSLESLIPPSFQRKFKIYFYDQRDPDSFGVIRNSEYQDFDYKIEASVLKNMKVKIKLFRNEFDHTKFPKEFFTHEALKNGHFKKKDFESDFIEFEYSIPQLLESSSIDNSVFEQVGAFDMSFLFMKRAYSKDDSRKFFYKDFDFQKRKDRLMLFSGVKIYRDNFKVRPYGEIGGNSFDWLGLGERVTISPAGPTHKTGRWRVRAAQVIGSLNISRIKNEMFEDKSSREGIQENDAFLAFKNLVIAIIDLFENDRQTIMRSLNTIFLENDESANKIQKADDLLDTLKAKDSNKGKTEKEKEKEQEVIIEAYKAQKSQIEELMSENKLLMGLASTGLTISAFSHELKNIKSNLLLKTENLEKYIHESIDLNVVAKLKEYQDPRVLVKDLHEMNKRINNWLSFTLECVKQDKRRRKKVNLDNYFRDLKKMWDESLARLQTTLTFNNLENDVISKKMFPLDLDTVFNNLIINSVYAFEDRKDGKSRREIKIEYSVLDEKKLKIIYKDSGPGLDPAIRHKDDIFEALFTTKKTDTGDVVGTGMGMWMVKKSVSEYKGTVKILDSKDGFKLEIVFPLSFGDA